LASRSKALLALGLAFAATDALASDAQTHFILQCQGCHTASGAGLEGKVPDLRPTLVPMAAMPAGRRYLIQVPGVAQSNLSDREIASVLNWMLRNLANPKDIANVEAFTQAEVTKYRSSRLLDVRVTREKLLGRIAANGR
jgi:mono/diheme cytochrome c family protein